MGAGTAVYNKYYTIQKYYDPEEILIAAGEYLRESRELVEELVKDVVELKRSEKIDNYVIHEVHASDAHENPWKVIIKHTWMYLNVKQNGLARTRYGPVAALSVAYGHVYHEIFSDFINKHVLGAVTDIPLKFANISGEIDALLPQGYIVEFTSTARKNVSIAFEEKRQQLLVYLYYFNEILKKRCDGYVFVFDRRINDYKYPEYINYYEHRDDARMIVEQLKWMSKILRRIGKIIDSSKNDICWEYDDIANIILSAAETREDLSKLRAYGALHTENVERLIEDKKKTRRPSTLDIDAMQIFDRFLSLL